MIWILGIVILVGVAVVVVLAALVGVFRLPVRTAFGKVMPARDLTRPAITAVVVVFVLASIGLTLFRSYHPIPAGEVGVVSEFGKIVGQVGEGPQFIAPWRDLRRVNIKVQRAEFSDKAEGLGSVAAASLETQNVFFNVTLNWQVSPEAVQGLMRNVGVDFFNTLVPTRVRQFFKAEVVKFTAVDATRLREQIRTNVAADLAADLQQFSISVVSLQIDDISYEAAFEQSIEAKQVATQDALRAQEVVGAAHGGGLAGRGAGRGRGGRADRARTGRPGISHPDGGSGEAGACARRRGGGRGTGAGGRGEGEGKQRHRGVAHNGPDPVRSAEATRGCPDRDIAVRVELPARPYELPAGRSNRAVAKRA